MFLRNRLSLALIGLAGISASLCANDFRIISLSQIPDLTTLEFLDEGDVQQAPVSVSSFSKPYNIPATRQLAFFDKAPLPEEKKQPLFNVTFPENSQDQIVLLNAVNTPQGPTYRYELIDDSDAAFPAGSVFICNFMSEPVLIRLGKKQVVVNANQRSTVPLTNQDQAFNDGVAFAAEIDGHGRVFSSSSWYLVPTMKIFCVIYKDDHGQPKIRRIRLTS